MSDRRRTFLEQEDWKTIPWEDEPDSKSQLDGVTDIMADIPGLYEDLDILNSSSTTYRSRDSRLARDILDKCVVNLLKLESWFRVWTIRNPNVVSEVESSSMAGLTVDEAGYLFPTVLRYSSLGVANELTLYYSIRIQLLSICRDVDRFRESANTSTSAAREPEISWSPYWRSAWHSTSASIRLLAIEICRSAEYHILPCHAQAGTLLFLVPAQVAAKSLGFSSREGKWITDLLACSAGPSGLSFTKNSVFESGGLAVYKDALG